MTVGIPTLYSAVGEHAGRIQPVNYTPEDGSYCFCIGSDVPDKYDYQAVGDVAAITQDVDLTDVTLLSFAVAFRQTEGLSAGARRGLEATYPKAFSGGETLDVKVDGGGTQAITFQATDSTLEEIVDRCNSQLSGATAIDDNNQLKITSNTTGASSSIEITGGTAMAALGHSVGITSGELITFKLRFFIGVTEHYSLQPSTGDSTIFVKRTINTKAITGLRTLKWQVETV